MSRLPAALTAQERVLNARLIRLRSTLNGSLILATHPLTPFSKDKEHVKIKTRLRLRKAVLQSDVVALWIMLARGSANLCELLPQNTLWSDDEKAYFVDIKNQRDGIWYCLNILTPACLRNNKQLISFAESQDIFLLPV